MRLSMAPWLDPEALKKKTENQINIKKFFIK